MHRCRHSTPTATGDLCNKHVFEQGRPVTSVDMPPAAADAAKIVVRGAREHNLRNINVELPRNKLIVFTGLSGSGKSSLAFDTIYAEGQRRYVECLSAYARQFLGQMDKPDVDVIEGLSPAISIDQKSASRNPRSTVGTITEVYDYLRLLYARIGVPHCPNDGTRLQRQTPAADRRPGPRAARGHPLPGARPGRPRPQGRVRDAARGPRRRRATSAPGSTARSSTSPTSSSATSGWPATSSTRSRSSSTGSCAATASSGGSPTRWRRRCKLAEGVVEIELVAREGDDGATRDAHVQPAPRLPGVRQSLRGAGAPQLLVQLAVRRVPDVRRPRHAVRGRPRAASSPTRTCRSAPGRIAPWRTARTQYFTRMLEAVADAIRHRPRRAVAQAHRQAAEGHPARRRRPGQGEVQEPLRAHAAVRHHVRGRHPVAAAPPRGRRERLEPRAVSRGTCGRCRARRAAAPG